MLTQPTAQPPDRWATPETDGDAAGCYPCDTCAGYRAHGIPCVFCAASRARALAAEAEVTRLLAYTRGIPEALAGTELPPDAGGVARHLARGMDAKREIAALRASLDEQAALYRICHESRAEIMRCEGDRMGEVAALRARIAELEGRG